MVQMDRSLKDKQELRREAGPAFAQNQVVGVLNAEACGATNKVDGVEQVLNVENAHCPRMVLAGESGFEGVRCTLMSSASVVENDGYFAQDLSCLFCGKRFF